MIFFVLLSISSCSAEKLNADGNPWRENSRHTLSTDRKETADTILQKVFHNAYCGVLAQDHGVAAEHDRL